ncbi:phosphoribosylglycinamide formyltransferase [Halopseudomonas maritima]|uniref:phosphoribosylglycinamide formyltransferase n=1 Tax=Halopseudomonas maritima TaxID=2918528 RepID=UPI001EECF390|nr:phosphoribosylglycinamide formyltransferase [Halopseudomonas maritima]UJJ32311.1 phosphoribosylglycinamide formyltransferase [Halopseudomonas maritima]
MGCRIVVLISGSGSNLQAVLDDLAGADAPAEVVAVISNKAEAYGLERARSAGIETRALDHRNFADRAAYDQALIEQIGAFTPDLVLLAGFMRILTATFVTHFHGRLLNIHPSLLPKYKGLQTHQRALDAGDAEAGASIHFVTEELDGGPLVLQGRVAIHPDDDAASLATRVQQQEHRLYPLVVRWFASGRLRLINGVANLDGEPIPSGGLRLETIESSM